MNYNPQAVGVPYVRVHNINIRYPDGGQQPTATLEQSLAVTLADGTARKLEDLPSIYITFDFQKDGNTPIPLVNPQDASPLGQDTTLNMAMLNILAVVRHHQLLQE